MARVCPRNEVPVGEQVSNQWVSAQSSLNHVARLYDTAFRSVVGVDLSVFKS